uniref:Uncharacterized protein n=1 Tax=Opuntia streptacantha TaxID=393608 RepID=A0A7C9F238_OPUST
MIHVIVLHTASLLKKSSNSISNIFNWSVRIGGTKCFEPSRPVLCPHLWRICMNWVEVITVESVTSIYHRSRNIPLLAHYPRHTCVLRKGHLGSPQCIPFPCISIGWFIVSIFIFYLGQDDRTSL